MGWVGGYYQILKKKTLLVWSRTFCVSRSGMSVRLKKSTGLLFITAFRGNLSWYCFSHTNYSNSSMKHRTSNHLACYMEASSVSSRHLHCALEWCGPLLLQKRVVLMMFPHLEEVSLTYWSIVVSDFQNPRLVHSQIRPQVEHWDSSLLSCIWQRDFWITLERSCLCWWSPFVQHCPHYFVVIFWVPLQVRMVPLDMYVYDKSSPCRYRVTSSSKCTTPKNIFHFPACSWNCSRDL